jgi:dTDP-4-amino-4,6-dideoxygalactose transaminase
LKKDFPNADAAHKSCISIPHYCLLADRKEMQAIVDAFANVSAAKGYLKQK